MMSHWCVMPDADLQADEVLRAAQPEPCAQMSQIIRQSDLRWPYRACRGMNRVVAFCGPAIIHFEPHEDVW